jgi:hypothetical protein
MTILPSLVAIMLRATPPPEGMSQGWSCPGFQPLLS